MKRKMFLYLGIISCITTSQNFLSAQDNLLHIADEYYKLAETLTQEKQSDKAIAYYKKTIELNPQYIHAYLSLGAILEKNHADNEALQYYQQAAKLTMSSYDIYRRMGHILKKQERFADAVVQYRHALACRPNHTVPIVELANALNIVGHYDEALELYLKAFEINPNLYVALYNFGVTLKKFGRIHEAIAIQKKVIEQKPDYANAHFSLGLSYLTLGNFEQGWQEYEWRWAAYNENPKKFDCPVWDGSNPAGKTILLYAEQGFGDTLQFIRYAQLFKKKGATIILQTQNALTTLLAQCPYIDMVIKRTNKAPIADFHVPLMSLPLLYKTGLNSIPADIPYLYANQTLVDYWHEKLATDQHFKIGLCWQGNMKYPTASLRRTVAEKSITINHFRPLSQLPGISLYSLQKINGTDQLATLADDFVIKTFEPNFDENNGRFMDTAAIMKNLDLIITVDTAIAHLAGGLGVPVWVLLPQPADWRWMLEHTDSPWYPTMHLFRQKKAGNWEALIEEVIQALKYISPSTKKI